MVAQMTATVGVNGVTGVRHRYYRAPQQRTGMSAQADRRARASLQNFENTATSTSASHTVGNQGSFSIETFTFIS